MPAATAAAQGLEMHGVQAKATLHATSALVDVSDEFEPDSPEVANIPLQEGPNPAKQDAPTMGPVVGVVDASPPWATASQLLQLAQISRAELNPQAQAAIWIAHLEGHTKINVDAGGVVAAICREEAGVVCGGLGFNCTWDLRSSNLRSCWPAWWVCLLLLI